MSAAHPREPVLALFAGGELPWHSRFGVWRHVSGCAACRRLVDRFRRHQQSLHGLGAELPAGLDWDRLAAEMTANIRVGLAAGECVGPIRSRPVSARLGWKPAAAFACMAAMIAGGWWLNVPPDLTRRVGTAARAVWDRDFRPPATMDMTVSVASGRDGIEVKQNGAVMTLMNPGEEPSVVTASTQGAVRARYVDADTGQVTITNVYAQ